MKSFLIVDGNSILNRAFYGIRPLTTRDGQPTNAVYGVVTMLSKHLANLEPDYAACAFDMKAPTFRHEKFAAYKATRKGMPDDLAAQLADIHEVVASMGFRIIEKSGYEADDILGTMAKKAALESDDIHTYILTGDRDSLQLIDGRTSVVLAKTKEDVQYDEVFFEMEYGLPPSAFVDVKALMGDSSDNIPGVSGVGEKTALKLITTAGSLDGVYENIDAMPVGEAIKSKLRDGRDSAYMSRELATICRDAPLDVSVVDCARAAFDNDALYWQFTRLEFAAFIKRFGLTVPSDKPAEIQTAAPSGDCPTVVYFDGKSFIFDDGANRRILSQTDGALSDALTSSPLVCWNYSRLCSDAARCGVNGAIECAFDVKLAAYVLHPEESSELGRLAARYLASTDEVGADNAADIIRKLYFILKNGVQSTETESLLYDIEIPVSKILSDMELRGVRVDTDGLMRYGNELRRSEAALASQIFDAVGHDFNINSPKKLGEVLFDELGLPHGKKTKTGYSTNADVLDKLKAHPVVADVLEYRKLAKLRSTYCDSLVNCVDENSRIHTTYDQTGTATGRLSSYDPNLQNIPVRTAEGRELRKFFIPTDGERVFVDADYSQIELRLLAHISGDEKMIAAFADGIDIHAITASQVFGVPVDEVTPELRKRAKAVNFGIVYGIGDFSLSGDLGISRKEAAEYIQSYLAVYPKVGEYLKNVVEQAKADGFVTTMYNRRRYIPELGSPNKNLRSFGERVAMNSPIQGTAADIIKIAMVNVSRALDKSGIDAHLILQVHDELIIEAAKADAAKAAEILKREMEGAASLKVPLTADVSVGGSWYECK